MDRTRGVCLIVAVLAFIFSVCEADAKSKSAGKGTSSEPPPNLSAGDKARTQPRNVRDSRLPKLQQKIEQRGTQR